MIKKIFILFITLLLISGCAEKKEPYVFTVDDLPDLDYSNIQEFDFDLHSQEYLLVNLSELNVLYGKDIDKQIYPASLTKLFTLDTILHLCDNLDDTSFITREQHDYLIEENASIAWLEVNEPYTIEELLYALILPSGADAALALENCVSLKGYNLVDEMNKLCENLGLNNSHFTNTTGLHDDDLYTTLDDILKLVIDVLKYDTARKILKSTNARLHDDTPTISTLIATLNPYVHIYGGKTGTTDESGQSVLVFYEYQNRNYMLIVANAMGHKYKEYFHLDDALKVFEQLYKKS